MWPRAGQSMSHSEGSKAQSNSIFRGCTPTGFIRLGLGRVRWCPLERNDKSISTRASKSRPESGADDPSTSRGSAEQRGQRDGPRVTSLASQAPRRKARALPRAFDGLRLPGSSMTTTSNAQCCFCGQAIEGEKPKQVVLLLDNDARQGLYCHDACLRRVLHPSVPIG